MFNSPRARDLHEQLNSFQLANKLDHAEKQLEKVRETLKRVYAERDNYFDTILQLSGELANAEKRADDYQKMLADMKKNTDELNANVRTHYCQSCGDSVRMGDDFCSDCKEDDYDSDPQDISL